MKYRGEALEIAKRWIEGMYGLPADDLVDEVNGEPELEWGAMAQLRMNARLIAHRARGE